MIMFYIYHVRYILENKCLNNSKIGMKQTRQQAKIAQLGHLYLAPELINKQPVTRNNKF